MTRDDLKRAAALAALEYVRPGEVVGVGTGSTVRHFIAALAEVGPGAAVASSNESAGLLRSAGIEVVDLADAGGELRLYVDGADEIDPHLRLLKGRGGALTKEKALASASEFFVCIADRHKAVPFLGQGPVVLEVLSEAVPQVARRIEELGGSASERAGFVTDNGNPLVEATGLDLADPLLAEADLDAIPGVVECGIFARRHADVALLGTEEGVAHIEVGAR